MFPRFAPMLVAIGLSVSSAPSAAPPSSVPSALSQTSAPSASSASSAAPSSSAAPASSAAHVLNRLAFGPRPGDIAHLQRIGVTAWIEQQLHPERIDSRGLDGRLAGFRTLALDAETLFREYHQPAVQERRERQRQNGSQAADANQASSWGDSISQTTDPGEPARRGSPPSEAQRRDRIVLVELSEARVLRAIYGERQLEEVLVDFWFNHFNVFAGKGLTRAFVTAFERDAIRPHVLGDFRQMLEAVAKSPAMLFYLDNWMNATNVQQQPRAARGINENYARELLELHTLGVDGGYTQDDIVNVARAFTGWTMRPRQGTGFVFARSMHDPGRKTVLGRTIASGGGIEDGRQVLDLLVAHPSTARHIATKLAQRFVGDTPPVSLVDRAAQRFRDTGGDLREVTRIIVSSPEFLSSDTYRAKVKTPFEFLVSALRVTGAEVATARATIRVLRDLGMPLYFCQPPTGYDETADAWVSSGALVARMNFAVDLANGRLPGITLPRQGNPGSSADTTPMGDALALLLGSPEFQRQ